MITELSQLTNTGIHLKTQFMDTWQHQWLPKLTLAIKDNLSQTNQKRLSSTIDIENDLDNACGTAL